MRGAWLVTESPPNEFCLPQEVFKLGLGHGPLLVYLYLIYRKSLKHGADKMSCAVIGKAVGLCAKTVHTHLRMLADAGFINHTSADKIKPESRIAEYFVFMVQINLLFFKALV